MVGRERPTMSISAVPSLAPLASGMSTSAGCSWPRTLAHGHSSLGRTSAASSIPSTTGMAELELVASPEVRQAMRDYLNALEPVNLQFAAASQRFDPRVPPQEHATEIGQMFRAMDPYRERVLDAMRQDLGCKSPDSEAARRTIGPGRRP